MTIDNIKEIGLHTNDVLTAEAAFEWVLANTTLEFDISNIEELKALPSCVKLFAAKFCELMNMPAGVTSESIEGMSQSFDSTQKNFLIRQYADELMGAYIKSGAVFFRAQNKWA